MIHRNSSYSDLKHSYFAFQDEYFLFSFCLTGLMLALVLVLLGIFIKRSEFKYQRMIVYEEVKSQEVVAVPQPRVNIAGE